MLFVVVPRVEVLLDVAVELLLGRTGKVLFAVVVVVLEDEVDGSVVPEV